MQAHKPYGVLLAQRHDQVEESDPITVGPSASAQEEDRRGGGRHASNPGAGGAEGSWPLSEAKLAAPRLRRSLVDRPRVERLLDSAADAGLILVSAPAGAGKTTAVRAWLARRSATAAWLTLDARDDDPGRLWRYVATALDRLEPGAGQAALRRLGAVGGFEQAIDELWNASATFGHPLLLVLDDLQTVTHIECLASIEYAVRTLPANVQIVAITRVDPVLPLPELRAAGALAEVRAADLAFTTPEARELVVERGQIDLDAEAVATLRERTEGWSAALVLATLWLRTVDDPRSAVRDFGGDHRFVADYLTHEVIGSLPEEARAFVLRIAALGRFTAALCDAALERSDSAEALVEFERSNGFLTRLDRGGWYRVHSLFADYARFELASQDPGAVAGLHRRAASWLVVHGQPVEAIEHAAAAGDHDVVARLLLENHLALIRGGGARTLLSWVRALPDDVVIEQPELAVSAATAATMLGRAVERRRLLGLASRAEVQHPEHVTPYVQAVAGMVRAAAADSDVGDAVQAGRRAVAMAEAEADAALVAALGGYARALYLAGDLDEAWASALRAIEHPDAERRPPGHAFARSTLALVAAERGRLTQARIHAKKARSLVGAVGSSRTWLGANASAAIGSVLALEGSLAEAERELAYAEHFARDEVATVHHAWLLVLLGRVRCRRGRLAAAEATLTRARELLGELADAGRIPALATEVEREIALARERAATGGEILDPPSKAELAVLQQLASDLTVREIAECLFLSANTVRSHTRSLYRKLGVNTRGDAVARADALGLIDRTESPM